MYYADPVPDYASDQPAETALTLAPAPALATIAAPGWRENLRLFVLAWAAGFAFFMILLA